MRNKLLIDTSILASALFLFLLFFTSSFSNDIDTQILITVDSSNLESNKDNIENDLNTLTSVGSAEVSVEVGVISMEINNDDFNPKSVKRVLDKWGVDSDDDWDIEIIASSEF